MILDELPNRLERLTVKKPNVLGRWNHQAPASELGGVRVVYGWVHKIPSLPDPIAPTNCEKCGSTAATKLVIASV